MSGLSFHRLPLHNENLLTKWLVNIKRVNTPVNEYSRVCSEHFEGGKKKGKDDIPTIFAWSKTTKARPAPKERENPVGTSLTHHCIGIMAKLHPENHVSTCTTDLAKLNTEDKEILVKPAVVSIENNTDLKVFSDAAINTDVIQEEDASTQTEVPATKYCDASTQTDRDEYSTPLRVEQIQDNRNAIKFYTGFPSFQLLMACFTFLGPAVSMLSYEDHSKLTKGKPHKLSPLNEFFLMLCRLRLGLYEQDLAYRFQISQSSVSRICSTWINFCFFKFKELPIWPTRSIIDSHMPCIFQDLYPSTRCIIDATEIFIQKPQNPSAQQLTFSKYKNHNTYKALIAISPSGAISFVSDLFGGNISDKELTSRCGLLDLLEDGDSVMADKGFNIADLLNAKSVTLNIPPKLTDSSGQFSEDDRVKTRRIASVRIHVERAIGRVKNFNILESIPNSMHNMANQIFFVCAMLTNFHPPLVE